MAIISSSIDPLRSNKPMWDSFIKQATEGLGKSSVVDNVAVKRAVEQTMSSAPLGSPMRNPSLLQKGALEANVFDKVQRRNLSPQYR